MNKPELVERVARAIENARCTGREGPFGGYDYGYDTDFYGPEPEGGRYVVRDFRDPSSPTFGAWVHQTADRDEHDAAFKRLTEHHIATAAIEELGVERLVAALEAIDQTAFIAVSGDSEETRCVALESIHDIAPVKHLALYPKGGDDG